MYASPSIAAVLLGLALGAAPAGALVAGDLDPTFGTGGVVTRPDEFYRLVVQPDGKIVRPIQASYDLTEISVERLDAAGALDASFGSGGIGAIETGLIGQVDDLSLQADGKIVVAGIRESGGYRQIAIARFDTAGMPDAGFGTGGLVVTDLGSEAAVRGIAIQPDQKIVVLGIHDLLAPTSATVIARYETDGSPDLSFGTLGVVEIDINVGFIEIVRDIVIQPDGKFVIVGGFATNAYLVRLDATGVFDPTFGTAGRAIASGPLAAASFYDFGTLALQADGGIVVGGYVGFPNGNSHFALARVAADGSLDSGFGSAGLVVTDFFPPTVGEEGPLGEVGSVVIEGDGKIVATGWWASTVPYMTALALARYHTDGSRDIGFGAGGVVTVAGGESSGTTVALSPDGSIVTISDGGVGPESAVVRFVATGCAACQQPLVKLGKLTTPAGDDTLKFKGKATLPLGAPIDPATNGVRVLLTGLDGAVLSDVTIPGGAGWTTNGSGSTAKWKGATEIGGIGKVVVKKLKPDPLSPNTPIKFAVVGKTGSYAFPPVPVRARLIVDLASPEEGQCAEPYFLAPSCTFNGSGSTLKCK